MSLVVLRSWSDGPPKVRGIAPSESNDEFVYVPDHRGQFVTQEVTQRSEEQKVKLASSSGGGTSSSSSSNSSRRQTWNGGDITISTSSAGGNNPSATVKEEGIKIHSGNCSDYHDDEGHNNGLGQHRSSSIGAIPRWSSSSNIGSGGGGGISRGVSPTASNGGKNSDCKSSERHYKSLSQTDLNSQEHERISKATTTTTTTSPYKNSWLNETRKAGLKPTPERVSSRSSSTSPDHDYIAELDSTPPASPLSGRYRNLGPEIAACIPRRQLKFSPNWHHRDGGTNIVGFQWNHQQRRSLSNSTPSLSQDFYSSEEEKLSSTFSSQSSSKTSSPQPPPPPPQQQQPPPVIPTHHSPLRHLQRQFERNKEPERGSTIQEETPSQRSNNSSTTTTATTPQSNYIWDGEEVRLKKTLIESRSSPTRGHYRRPRQRQLLSSPSTPPPPPPEQHDYYRSISTSSTVSLDRACQLEEGDEEEYSGLDSAGRFKNYLSASGKKLSISSEEDESTDTGLGNSGKSDVILVEVIRKKIKSTNNTSKSTTSSGFSASGSDSGSDKDSADSSGSCRSGSGWKSEPNKFDKSGGGSGGKILKTILKKTTSEKNSRYEHVGPAGRIEQRAGSSDSDEKLCDGKGPQVAAAISLPETEQIEQDIPTAPNPNCLKEQAQQLPTHANKATEKSTTSIPSTPPNNTSSADEPKVVVEPSRDIHDTSRREPQIFYNSTPIIPKANGNERERAAAEIQDDGNDDVKGEKIRDYQEGNSAPRPPVEAYTLVPPGSQTNGSAQFPFNSEQNPRLSALPIIVDSHGEADGATAAAAAGFAVSEQNQSESIHLCTATGDARVISVIEPPISSSSDTLKSGTAPLTSADEVASVILDQVLAAAKERIEEINNNSNNNNNNNHNKNQAGTTTGVAAAVAAADLNYLPESPTMERGKLFEGQSPIASVKIPVQAVNKYVRSDSSDEFETEFIWRNTSVRDSFRGFCQELLESSSTGSSSHEAINEAYLGTAKERPAEKIVIHVSQPQTEPQSLLPTEAINEGVIEFEDDEEVEEHHHHREHEQRNGSDLGSSGRAETPLQQCNNSIEYISVRDNVQVNGAVNRRDSRTENNGSSSDNHNNVNPQPIKWIITLDLGSRNSGFSYWGHVDENVVHIGSWAGDNCRHKIPSWILTTEGGPKSSQKKVEMMSAVKMGQDALDEYMEHGDSKCTFVSQWREFFQLDPDAAKLLTFPYTLDSVDDEMEFSKLVAGLVEFFGRAAVSQMQSKFGPEFNREEHIEWLITVPSGWNTHSRQCIREAAYKSSVVKEMDGVNLIEDPTAAALFASMCGKYDNFLAVDVGGAYMHYSGFSRMHGNMVQSLEGKSLPLPTPESNFEQLLTQIVSREFMLYYKAKYKAGWVELVKNFERAKCKFDAQTSPGVTRSSAFIFFPCSFVTEFHGYTGMDLSECIQEHSSGITWNENGALRIPQEEMELIVKPTVDFVVGKIGTVLRKFDFENIVVTGGCGKCKFLNESIAAEFPELKIIMPKEFSSGVLQGATLSLMPNIEPKLVIKSPFSIGVGVMTPFQPEQHPEEKKIVKDGKTWCADVWDTLIKHGQEMEINSVVNKRAYVGAQPGQTCLVLPLFKSSAPGEPMLVTDKSVTKCCELRFESTKTWHEIDLILTCRASELIVMAVDRESLVHRVVIDIL